MADTAVTNVAMVALNTKYEYATTAATADVDNTAETFAITPTGKRGLLIIGGTGSLADGDIGVKVVGGDLWMGADVTFTATKNKTYCIEVDTAKVMGSDGKIQVTLTPAATDKLLTDHAAFVGYIQMVH